MQFDGQEIGWHQIVGLYEWDLGPMRNALGLRFQPKLRDEHVNLTPQSRMRVNLAAQVGFYPPVDLVMSLIDIVSEFFFLFVFLGGFWCHPPGVRCR